MKGKNEQAAAFVRKNWLAFPAALALVIGLAFISCGGETLSDPDKHEDPSLGKTWTWSPVASVDALQFGIYGVAYGVDKFVAVGYSDPGNARIAYSTTGEFWASATTTSFATFSLVYVAHGGGKFVAATRNVSANGINVFVTSPNGVDWTPVANASAVTFQINALTYGGEKFVAVGETLDGNGKIAYSPDGATWQAVTSPLTFPIDAVAYGGGMFVATGYTGSDEGFFAYSTDGVGWTQEAFSAHEFKIDAIAYGGGTFVAASYDNGYSGSGKVAWSTNGTAWDAATFSALQSDIIDIAYGGGIFAAFSYYQGAGRFAYSLNGKTWAKEVPTFDALAFTISAAAYGGGKFVVVGRNNSGGGGRIAYSNNH